MLPFVTPPPPGIRFIPFVLAAPLKILQTITFCLFVVSSLNNISAFHVSSLVIISRYDSAYLHCFPIFSSFTCRAFLNCIYLVGQNLDKADGMWRRKKEPFYVPPLFKSDRYLTLFENITDLWTLKRSRLYREDLLSSQQSPACVCVFEYCSLEFYLYWTVA